MSFGLVPNLGPPEIYECVWAPQPFEAQAASHTPGAATETSSQRTTGRSSPLNANQSIIHVFFLGVNWRGKCWKFNVEPDPPIS